MRTAWVTGARGFIGRHLCQQLEQAGVRVAGLGHGPWSEPEYTRWGLSSWVNGEVDASNLDLLARTEGTLPDAVFHLAGGSSVGVSYASPLEDFSRTVSTTARLVDWLRVQTADVRLVAVSSAAVYGSGHNRPIEEGANLAPMSPYGRHKVMMEQLCLGAGTNFGLRCSLVRLFSVYGPELKKQLVWDLCRRLLADQESLQLAGSGDELRDWLHVEDAARLLIAAADRAAPEGFVVNGGTGHGTSVCAIAEQVATAWGVRPSITFSGESRPGDPDYLVASVVRAKALGMKPQLVLGEALKDVVAHYRRILRA